MANNSQSNQVGVYIPTTEVWDVAQLYQVDVTSPEFKELLVRMYQNLNRMALALNVSTKGYYDIQGEFVDGNLWFQKPGLTSKTSQAPVYRQEYRTVLNLPQVAGIALGAGATTINHNITVNAGTLFTLIYATASDTVGNNYYPIPWASAAGTTNIEIKVNATQVTITNNSGINFTDCFVVLQYIQN